MLTQILLMLFCSLQTHAFAYLGEEQAHEEPQADNPWENHTATRANTECEPTAIVDGNVCVITGDFIEALTDLILPGLEPIELKRHYASSAEKNTNMHFGWSLNHHGYILKAFENEKLHAFFCNESSATMHYSLEAFNPMVINRLHFDSDSLKKGITNCGHYEISGRTNCKNTVITVKNANHFRGKNGTGHKYYFGSKLISSQHSYVHPLLRIKKCNGHQWVYHYDDSRLTGIEVLNPNNETYNAIAFSYPADHVILASVCDGRKIKYRSRKNLEGFGVFEVSSNFSMPQKYTYSKKNKRNPSRIIRKEEPEGRFLEIEYFRKGNPLYVTSEDIIESKYDPRIGRVKALKKPVGTDGSPITTHRFEYDVEVKGIAINKTLLGGATTVYDACNHKVCYHYSDEHRLKSFEKYSGTSDHALYAREKFYWGSLGSKDDSHLISKTLEEPNGRILSCRHFKYDKRGNIFQETWWGNLTGTNSNCVILNDAGSPQPNNNECYKKKFRYTSDGLNLKTYESDTQHAIIYRYYPGTDRLHKKFLKAKGLIHLRHFYEYDSQGSLTKEIVDDGYEENQQNLSGVTERRIKIIRNRICMPFGLPEEIHEGYENLNTRQFVLLHKFINDYDLQGHLIRQDHYDSNDQLAFSLHWEYDEFGHILKEINALGHVIEKKYDPNGNKIFQQGPCYDFYTCYFYDYANRPIKTEIVSCEGTKYVTACSYDYLGNKVSSTDLYGNDTLYFYDDFGRRVQTQYPKVASGNEASQRPCEKFEYDFFGNVTLFEDALGRKTLKKFNLRGQPLEILYPDSTLERFEYDLNGNLIKSISKTGAYALYSYDYQSRLSKTEHYSPESELLSTATAIYNAFHLLEETDPEGVITSYKYDEAGRLSVTKKGNQKQTCHYDSLGRLAETHEYYGFGPKDYIVKKNIFDNLNKIIEERTEDPQGKIEWLIQHLYDELGHKTTSLHFTQNGLSIHKTTYDILGNVVNETDPLGNTTVHTHRYDICNSMGQYTPCVETSDPLGRLHITFKDAMGRTASKIIKNPLGEIIHQTDFSYNLGGLLLEQVDTITSASVIPRQAILLWDYDPFGRVAAMIQAAYTPEQKTTQYTYNRVGLQEKLIKPDGTIISTRYDTQNRPIERYSSDKTCHYTYTYNRKGSVIKIEDKIHTMITQKSYDDNDRLISETLGHGFTMKYRYDRLGRIKAKILPDQSHIACRYKGEFLSEVSRFSKNDKLKYFHRYLDYDLSGNLLKHEMINNCGSILQSCDLLGRPLETNSPYWHEVITEYDPLGNLLSRNFQDIHGIEFCKYAYDPQNQLIHEEGEFFHNYTYDSLYNRTSKNELKYDLNALNQILNDSHAVYRYDLNGRLTAKECHLGNMEFHYDALDRLTSIVQGNQKTLYLYDNENRRLQKTVQEKDILSNTWKLISDSYFLYEGLNEIGRLDPQGNIVELRVLGNGLGAEIGAAVAIEIDNFIYVPVNDINGNIRSLIDAYSGEVIETYRFSTFGEEKIYNEQGQIINESINPWRFISKRKDAETQFLYFGHRYYDPETGRWITPDPMGFDAGPNLYAYLSNNPLGHFDLYGLFEETPWEGYQREQSEPRSFIDRTIQTIGRAIEAIGDYLMPVPYVREAISYVGHRMAGGSRESFKNKGLTGRSHVFDLGKQELNPQANIIYVNGILNSKSSSTKNAEQISKTQDCNNVHIIYNSSHGFIFDLFECLAQRLGFQTHSVKLLVKTLKERINALGGPLGGGKILLEGHSQGGLIANCALKYLTPEEKKMMHVITYGSAKMVSSHGLGSAVNYVSYRDPIPYIADPLAHIRHFFNKKEGIKYLKSSSFPFVDHPLRNATYSQALSIHAKKTY